MFNTTRRTFLATASALVATGGFASAATDARLETVATNDKRLWNGVTLSKSGRVFVSLPNWLGPSAGVGEITKTGELVNWPGTDWNKWSPGKDATKGFVNVNAIRMDPSKDTLWVVDSGAPIGGTRTRGAGKLVGIDINSGKVVRNYPLDEALDHPRSSPNDVRFNGRKAYFSEPGTASIIVLDLETGVARHVLRGHPLLVANPEKTIMIDGQELRGPDGGPFPGNANQLEVSPDGKTLFIQPLNGGVARIETSFLDDMSASEDTLKAALAFWIDTPPLSGTAMDANGNIYLNTINDRSIVRLTLDGKMQTLITDERLRWADASWVADGSLWVPPSQLGWTPMMNNGTSRLTWPNPLLKMRLS